MKKLILAAALLLCAAVPADAQQEPTPGELALVREFMEVSRMRETMARTMEAMLESGLGEEEEVTPGFTDALREFMAEHFRFEAMEPGFTRMYADLFTEDELRALIAFYRTPAGQRMVELTPEISVRTQQITNEVLEEAMPALMELMMGLMEEDMEMDVEAEKVPRPPRKS